VAGIARHLTACPTFNRSTGGGPLAEGLANSRNQKMLPAVRQRERVMIDFEYDLDEIVQMEGKGTVSLRTALIHMPDRVGPMSVLWRDAGKTPAFFDTEQIQALLDRHRPDLGR
jgi:hypothetical protein